MFESFDLCIRSPAVPWPLASQPLPAAKRDCHSLVRETVRPIDHVEVDEQEGEKKSRDDVDVFGEFSWGRRLARLRGRALKTVVGGVYHFVRVHVLDLFVIASVARSAAQHLPQVCAALKQTARLAARHPLAANARRDS